MHKTESHVSLVSAPALDEDLVTWVEQQSSADRPWLLAHADDGVIWGRRNDDGRLITSHQLASHVSPPLRLLTIQQAFVFGERGGDVRLWRGEDGWQARLITDASDAESIDETQVLWGTEVINNYPDQGFTHVRETRQQGLDHVVPLVVTPHQLAHRQLRLLVRHFIEYNEATGEARLGLSRLVKVFLS
jgi:CRISPR-associated protein (TIGR03984 family)